MITDGVRRRSVQRPGCLVYTAGMDAWIGLQTTSPCRRAWALTVTFLACFAGHAALAYGPPLAHPDIALAAPAPGVALVAPVPGGSIVHGDFALVDGQPRRRFARLDEQGRLDPGWRARGLACLINGSCLPRIMRGLPDGSLLICSNSSDLGSPPTGGLVRLDPSGHYDAGWNPFESAGLVADNRDCLGLLVDSTQIDARGGRNPSLQIAVDAETGAAISAFATSMTSSSPGAADGRFLYRTVSADRAIERYARASGIVDSSWRIRFPQMPRIDGHDPDSRSLIVTYLNESLTAQQWSRVDIRAGAIDSTWQPAVPPPHPTYRVRVGAGRLVFPLCEAQDWFNCRLNSISIVAPGQVLWQTTATLPRTSQVAAIDATGRVFLTGGFTGSTARPLERVTADGVRDETFLPNLHLLPDVSAVVSDRGGSVVVGPRFANQAATCGSLRVDSHGQVDGAWSSCPLLGSTGFTIRRGTAFVADGTDLLFAGTFWNDTLWTFAYIERASSGGARSVIVDGITSNQIPTQIRERIDAIGLDAPAGTLVAGGNFNVPVCGQARRHLFRIATTGYCVLDPAFAPQPDAPVTALARAADGGWYVAGRFGTIGGVATGPLARLGSDAAGTVSPDFAPLDRIEKAGQVVAPAGLVATADALYLYGDFDRVDGLPRAGLARVMLADGSLDTAFAPALAGRPLSVLADGRWLDVAVDRGNAGLPATDQVCRVDVVTGGVHHCTDTDGDLTAIVATGRDSVRVAGAYTRVGGVERIGIADLPRTLFADGLE